MPSTLPLICTISQLVFSLHVKLLPESEWGVCFDSTSCCESSSSWCHYTPMTPTTMYRVGRITASYLAVCHSRIMIIITIARTIIILDGMKLLRKDSVIRSQTVSYHRQNKYVLSLFTPPATKLMSHCLPGRSTLLHQQQEKHDLRLLTDGRLERQAV